MVKLAIVTLALTAQVLVTQVVTDLLMLAVGNLGMFVRLCFLVTALAIILILDIVRIGGLTVQSV
jgi:hypothetical protein